MTEKDLENIIRILLKRKNDNLSEPPLYEFDTLIEFGIECYNQAMIDMKKQPIDKHAFLTKMNLN
jgi:hypothetical protein